MHAGLSSTRRAALAAFTALAALAPPAQAAPVLSQGTWASTLQARDINGDGTTDAFYDTTLNITWLADAKAAAGSGFDTTYGSGYQTWPEAMAWAAQLNVYGTTGWRLPTMIDTGNAGCDLSYAGGTDCGYNVPTISADGQTVFSELAHLYYVTLGNLAYCTPGDDVCNNAQPGWGLTNTGDFRNLEAWAYWSGVPYAPFPADDAWYFHAVVGGQSVDDQVFDLYALPVRPGDVPVAANGVPEPQTLLLALLALSAAAVARRQRAV